MKERREKYREPFAISMEQAKGSMRWQEITKAKWAKEDKKKADGKKK